MDTHFAPSPELEARGSPLSARLPGEPDPDAVPAAEHSGTPEQLSRPSGMPRARSNPAALLGGAAVVGVFLLAGSVFLVSPYNHVVPVPPKVAAAVRQAESSAGIDPGKPLAPSAALASVDLPARPSSVVLPRYEPSPRDQDLSELLSIRPGSAAAGSPGNAQAVQPKPGTPAAAAPAFVPHEPGSAIASAPPEQPPTSPRAAATAALPAQPRAGVRDITPTVLAAATLASVGPERPAAPILEPGAQAARPADAAPTPVPAADQSAAMAPAPDRKPDQAAVAPVSPPPDAVKQALRLQAAPMSGEEQIKVLELVTQMATVVRDLKAQNATLRADFARATADEQARLADFARRMDLTEATSAVAAAQQAGDLPAAPAPTVATPVVVRQAMALAPVPVTRPDVALPAAAPEDAKRYRVQAASPGLALLAEIARGGGEGAQIQVTVGDVIPGWGKVKSVAQRGTSWVVSTEHGAIE